MELSDTLCRSLSENTVIPVILLTVRDGAQDMVQGLSIGADDYVTKPFRMDVLVSRIRAVLRRVRNRRPEDGSLYCGDVCINKKTSKVYKKDCPVELTPNEYQLLLLLLEHKNQTITRILSDKTPKWELPPYDFSTVKTTAPCFTLQAEASMTASIL